MNFMRFTTSFLAGLLLTGILAIAPDTSFAHGGGGGGHGGGGGGGGHFGGGGGHFGGGSHFAGASHFGGGGHFGGFHGGFANHGFAHVGHGGGAWHHDGRGFHHGYGGYYGYYAPYDYAPFDYGFDNYDGYAYPYYDNGDYFDAQSAPSAIAPQDSTISVQRKLTQLGYYHGPIDGIVGSKTEQAIRWFQSVDKLPVTGQIDSATLQALRIG
jgi:hypothetical protein